MFYFVKRRKPEILHRRANLTTINGRKGYGFEENSYLCDVIAKLLTPGIYKNNNRHTYINNKRYLGDMGRNGMKLAEGKV